MIAFESDGQGVDRNGQPLGNVSGVTVINSDGSQPRSIADGQRPAWAPDGRTIVYDDGHNLFTIGTDGTGRHQLTSDGGTTATWSSRNQTAYQRPGSIYIMSASGGPSIRLTAGYQPDFSANGGRILFDRRLAHATQLFTIDTNRRHLHQLTHRRGFNGQPAFSPDGQRIVFIHNSDVWLMQSNGTRTHRLASSGGGLNSDANPSWQPLPH
jgi:TolB protein